MSKIDKQAVLIGGIAAFAIMYLYKLENREKAKVAMKNTKAKVESYRDSRRHAPTQMTKAGFSDPEDPDDNRMIEEGAMTSVQYYNEKVQDGNGKKDFPKSQKKKQAPITEESLQEDNNDSPAKQENTKRMPPK